MQAEIRRIAAEQARIKAEQERQRKLEATWKGIESSAKANPYNVLNLLKHHGWTIQNLRNLFTHFDDNLDEEEERILQIAQIGLRKSTQQVAT